MAAVIKKKKKKLLNEVERGNRETRRRVLPLSGSKMNKDLHTVIAKQVKRAGHTF